MSSRTASEVRASFLDFFAGKGHEVCASAPLVPQNDPTLMFTNAGMVQFKDVFTGKDARPFKRATSSQKCIRISGKHNDLENVGVTARHHTFFEMLGNFSFGDYFKEDAIAFAWELLTKVYAIPTDRLVVTVFGGADGVPADDEARAIWKKVTGFGDERIIGIPACRRQLLADGRHGPLRSVHRDPLLHRRRAATLATLRRGADAPTARAGWRSGTSSSCSSTAPRRSGATTLAPLPAPSVDTGAGLERVAGVLQGKTSNYDTDLLRALVDKAARHQRQDVPRHARATTTSRCASSPTTRAPPRSSSPKGMFPDRAGREYVLRRVMRRAIRHGHRLGIAQAVPPRGRARGRRPHGRRSTRSSASARELDRARRRAGRGALPRDHRPRPQDPRRGDRAPQERERSTIIRGDAAFKLYDTYGFPLDLTEVIARERALDVDTAGYESALEEQKARSEGSKVGDEAVADVYRAAARPRCVGGDEHGGVRFTGYEREEGGGARCSAIVRGKERADAPTHAKEGEQVAIVVDETPFYGESGGQVGDRSRRRSRTARARAVRLPHQRRGHAEAARGPRRAPRRGARAASVEGRREACTLDVDHARRTATRRNHSATHLLHWALRTVLGEQAHAEGLARRARPPALRLLARQGRSRRRSSQRIEDLVNEKVLTDAPVETRCSAWTRRRSAARWPSSRRSTATRCACSR